MTENSSYVSYLPPALWSNESDPTQLLGRALRVFEKILTGIPINAEVVRASAPLVAASDRTIQLANAADRALFRSGDLVAVDGTAERVQINRIGERKLVLASKLSATFTSGTVRIADLQPAQQVLRVDNAAHLGPGVVVEISQGPKSETAVVAEVSGQFVWLQNGLIHPYPLGGDSVPVRLSDGLPLMHGNHAHPPLEATIDQLHRLFDPRATGAEFLPWLANWVALGLRSDLSEYQQRKLVGEIVPIYRQRGLKQALLAYLDVFDVIKARPRIVIDAGEAVFRARFAENGVARLHPIAYSTNFPLPEDPMTALLHPSAIAVDARNNAYIVADLGDSQRERQPAVWRIAANTGAFEYTAGADMPLPKPLYLRRQASPPSIDAPSAVVVEAAANGDRYCVLDAGEESEIAARTAIYRLTSPNFELETVIGGTTNPQFTAVMPMDMIQDMQRNFVVLDRGSRLSGDPPLGGPSKPKLIVVKEGPLSVEEHPLDNLPDGDPAKVIEPTALAMDGQGRFLVVDAGDQFSTRPANLVRVDPSDNWTQEALLPAIGNPLVYPTGLVFEHPDSLLVCDTGLRNGYDEGSEPGLRYMAEPPAIYRIDLRQRPPTISRITEERSLVWPTKMAIDENGDVLIVDRGESLRDVRQRNWRTQPHEFGVIVNFAIQRPGAGDVSEAGRGRRQIRNTIANIIDEQKPAHVSFWLKG